MTSNCLTQGRSTRARHQFFRRSALAIALASAGLSAGQVMAQDNQEQGAGALEEILVTGAIRDTLRNSVEIKRDATTIVDALSASEMGALPDLSVAETLERITGVTGDRFKGNSSEISVRGLGPFLGASTYNGREVSSGSGNRSVAFSQFPSELVNGAVVYKAQQASLLEGGVAGVIDLRSLRPIDFGKRRIQGEVKANYNEYDAKLNGDDGIGYRGSLSFTDVFDTEIGTIGVALGYAGHESSTPEESYNTSSTLRNCNSDYVADQGGSGGWNPCSWSDDNAAAGDGAAADGPYYFVPNLQYFRQMESEEERNAFMGTVQWQPNDDWDITLDVQESDRFYYEDRHDLYIDDGRNNITNWETNDAHALTSYTGYSRFSTYGEYRERDEQYSGGGLNIEWNATDRLLLRTDLSVSDTTRYQETWQTRFRSDRYFFDWEANGDDWPLINRVYSDLDDPENTQVERSSFDDYSFYDGGSSDGRRARYREFLIEDTINAFRFEGEYSFDQGFITSIDAGVRVSEHDHNNYSEDTWAVQQEENTYADVEDVGANCGTDFPQSGYGEDTSVTYDTWATYDTLCAFDRMVGNEDWSLTPEAPSSGDVVLSEDVASAFVMANFESEWGGVPVTGNFGVRVVETDVTSEGYRQSFIVETTGAGTDEDPLSFLITEDTDTLTQETYTNSYTNVLPSVNVNFLLREDLELRTALYKAVSRPDMWWLGAGRDLNLGGGEEEYASIEEAVEEGSVTAFGNPNMESIESENFDISLGWYPSEDTAISAALYHKRFNAGLDTADDVYETFVINGQPAEMEVNGIIENTGEESTINGIELTVQHGFTSLPEPFDGLGFSAGVNFADTDFEYPENGSEITDDIDIAPANLPGFSDESYNVEGYWEKYGASARLSYKYRSEYLKPFGSDFGQTNRYVQGHDSLDLSLAYNLNANLQIKLQALNLANDAYVEYRVAEDAFNRIEYSGRKFFLGLRFRM